MSESLADMDRQILELISRRSRAYINEVLDRRKPGERYSPEDLKRLAEFISRENRGPLPDRALENIYREMLAFSLQKAEPFKVAFLGPEGTFSHLAILEIFSEGAVRVPAKTISDIFREVENGEVSYGVVPVENSAEGAVTYTLDELKETDLSIVSEKYLRISYGLLSKCGSISEIRRVYSHPQSLGQCKGWIRANLPGIEIISVSSTSQAAALSAKEGGSAAIASELSASLFGLTVLARRIEDSRQNFTRFFVIGRQENSPTGNDKTSIICAVRDRPGALIRLLSPLSEYGINMTKIESRPDKKKIWAYDFFIDFTGHKEDEPVVKTLERIKEESIFLKILGSYPAGN